MKRVAANFVPKLQKYQHMSIAQELLNDVNDDINLRKKIITGDQTYLYG